MIGTVIMLSSCFCEPLLLIEGWRHSLALFHIFFSINVPIAENS